MVSRFEDHKVDATVLDHTETQLANSKDLTSDVFAA
jgi:hypothetical protein